MLGLVNRPRRPLEWGDDPIFYVKNGIHTGNPVGIRSSFRTPQHQQCHIMSYRFDATCQAAFAHPCGIPPSRGARRIRTKAPVVAERASELAFFFIRVTWRTLTIIDFGMSDSFRLETQGKKHLVWKWWSFKSGFQWKLVTIGGKAATVLVTPTCRRRLAVEPSSPCLLDVPWDPPSLWEPWQSWLPQHALDDRQYCKRIPSKICSWLFDSWGIYGIILILFRNGLFCLQRNYHRLPRFIYCILYLPPCHDPGRPQIPEGSYQTALSESKRLGSSSQVRPKQRAATVLFAAKGGRLSLFFEPSYPLENG